MTGGFKMDLKSQLNGGNELIFRGGRGAEVGAKRTRSPVELLA